MNDVFITVLSLSASASCVGGSNPVAAETAVPAQINQVVAVLYLARGSRKAADTVLPRFRHTQNVGENRSTAWQRY